MRHAPDERDATAVAHIYLIASHEKLSDVLMGFSELIDTYLATG